MKRTLKRTLELQLGRSLTENEYSRVALKMQTLKQLTRKLKTALKNDPAEYDLLVWQVVLLGDRIMMEVL